MFVRMLVAVALCAALGCGRAPVEAVTASESPDAFTGTWRSVTPSLEFIGLTVVSTSSEMGVLGIRLTYSGLAFDGRGRIDGDSLVADMTVAGSSQPSGTLVAHVREGDSLHVERRNGPASSAILTLDFVRER
jgi:hypothetical protein